MTNEEEQRMAELETALNRYSEQEILGGTVLPCTIDRCNIETGEHDDGCPAYYRQVVGGAIATAKIEGQRKGLNRAREFCWPDATGSDVERAICDEIAALGRGKGE